MNSENQIIQETEPEKEKSLNELISEVAEEEGMTFEETKALFQKGMRDVRGINLSTRLKRDKSKAKLKRRMSKQSRKKNR